MTTIATDFYKARMNLLYGCYSIYQYPYGDILRMFYLKDTNFLFSMPEGQIIYKDRLVGLIQKMLDQTLKLKGKYQVTETEVTNLETGETYLWQGNPCKDSGIMLSIPLPFNSAKELRRYIVALTCDY